MPEERRRRHRRRPAPGSRSRRRVTAALASMGATAVLLTACASPQESGAPSSRVTSWLTSSSGGSSIGTLSADSRNVGYALARGNTPAAVRTVCAVLTDDAQTAIGNLPSPDPVLTQALDRAYEDAAAAGSDCYDGAGVSAARMARSARERTALPALLDAAMARIVAVTGHTPSTSTTAPAPGGDPFGG